MIITAGFFVIACHLASSMPMDSAKGDFLGCYLDPPLAAKNTRIEGVPSASQCTDICEEKYFRYALMYRDSHCMCSNFLGNIISNEKCAGGVSNEPTSDAYHTAVKMNGPPTNFTITNVTDTEAILQWNAPESFISIDGYKLIANILFTYSMSQQSSYSWINIYSNDTNKVNLVTLHPGTKYNMTLQADNMNAEGAKTYKVIETLIGEPDTTPMPPTMVKKQDTSMVIRMEPVFNNNGPVTSYLIVVIEANSVQAVSTENLQAYSLANSDGVPYYITAEIQPKKINEPFVVGDAKIYGKYFNAPLQKGKDYHIMLGMLSRLGNQEYVVYSDATTSHVEVIMSHIPTQEAGETSTIIVVLSLCIIVISLLLVAGLIGFYFLRTRIMFIQRQRLNDNQELTMQGPMIDVENNGYIAEEELPQASTRSTHLSNLNNRVWQIPQSALTIDNATVLAYGKYGRVHPGNVSHNEQVHNVHVYCINDKKLNPQAKRNMLIDLDLLIKSIRHSNVIDLIGTCDRSDLVAVSLESIDENLKDHLLKSRQVTGNTFSSMPKYKAIDLAYGIMKGMAHLHTHRITHKELCSMHIGVVNSQAKIFGFGLAKFYENEAPNMLRYTAREILQGQAYTMKGDSWSFAVILWEICTLGATPYGNIPNENLAEKIIKNNIRLPQLPYIQDTLYQLMLNCWQIDYDERPTFEELREHLEWVVQDDCLNYDLHSGFKYEPHFPELEKSFDNLS